MTVPDKRPAPKPGYIAQLLEGAGVIQAPVILGRRGYFDALGQPGINDIGIFDDAFFICEPDKPAIGFNGNTDPTTDTVKGRATLMPGRWKFRLGMHNMGKAPEFRYKALIQAGPMIVSRHDTSEFVKGQTHATWGLCLGGGLWMNNAQVPSYGINNHKGGENTTTSEGCQTVYRPQWQEYIDTVERIMTAHKMTTIDYILTAFKPS